MIAVTTNSVRIANRTGGLRNRTNLQQRSMARLSFTPIDDFGCIESNSVFDSRHHRDWQLAIFLRLLLVVSAGMIGCSRNPNAARELKEQLDSEHVSSVIADGRIQRVVFYEVTDRGLELVNRLRELEDLSFHQTIVNDEQLRRLSSLAGIRYLNLSWSDNFAAAASGRRGITDKGIECILCWDGIQFLDLSGTQITDAGVAKLASLSELRSLQLRNTAVSDAGLEALAGLSNLQSLDLSACEQVGERGVNAIARLPHLEKLFLHSTSVDDSAVEHFKQSLSLSYLGLSDTMVTDAALETLLSIRTLERVDVERTHVTPDGASAFRRKRPQMHLSIGSP